LPSLPPPPPPVGISIISVPFPYRLCTLPLTRILLSLFISAYLVSSEASWLFVTKPEISGAGPDAIATVNYPPFFYLRTRYSPS